MSFVTGVFGPLSKRLNLETISLSVSSLSNDSNTYVADNLVVVAGFQSGSSTDKVHRLPHNRGMLVGKIFQAKSDQYAQFNLGIEIDPQTLMSHFWGRYVGFFFNSQQQLLSLIRDPLGLSTIFYFETSEGIIFSTDIPLIYKLLPNKPSIDWNYFGEYIMNQNHALPITPFKGIRELLPGSEISFNLKERVSNKYLWETPFKNTKKISNQDEFEDELLSTLQTCTRAWIKDCKGVCVELSGGVDSSSVMILLSSVLSADQKLIAINYFDSSVASSDETQYAKEVAELCNAPVFFIDRCNARLFSSLPTSWQLNKPCSLLLSTYHTEQQQQLAAKYGCDITMNGQGGDHIFLAPAHQHALADLWLGRCYSDFLPTMQQLSEIYRDPWWQIIKNNLKCLRNYYFGIISKEPVYAPYFNSEFMDSFRLSDFYLDTRLKKIYPAKAEQLKGLHHATHYSESNKSPFFRNFFHPLLSQPLVELALQIPTYKSFAGGVNRIFLRRAVSRIKSPPALWRQEKSHTTGSVLKTLSKYSNEISDLLLQGSLAESGILKKQWIEEELVAIQHGQFTGAWPIMNIISSQLWLNQWKSVLL